MTIQTIGRFVSLVVLAALCAGCGTLTPVSGERLSKMSNEELEDFCKTESRRSMESCDFDPRGAFYQSAKAGCENGRRVAGENSRRCSNILSGRRSGERARRRALERAEEAKEQERMKDPAYRAARERERAAREESASAERQRAAERLAAEKKRRAESEKRKAEVVALWKIEAAAARTEDKDTLAARYPGLAWLSGMWCRTHARYSRYLDVRHLYRIIDAQNVRLFKYRAAKGNTRSALVSQENVEVRPTSDGYEVMEFNDARKAKWVFALVKESDDEYRIESRTNYYFTPERYDHSSSIEGDIRKSRREFDMEDSFRRCQ